MINVFAGPWDDYPTEMVDFWAHDSEGTLIRKNIGGIVDRVNPLFHGDSKLVRLMNKNMAAWHSIEVSVGGTVFYTATRAMTVYMKARGSDNLIRTTVVSKNKSALQGMIEQLEADRYGDFESIKH